MLGDAGDERFNVDRGCDLTESVPYQLGICRCSEISSVVRVIAEQNDSSSQIGEVVGGDVDLIARNGDPDVEAASLARTLKAVIHKLTGAARKGGQGVVAHEGVVHVTNRL